MPSCRAAAIAGAMKRCSSSPNNPPSPACGLSPATAMRGRGWPHAALARWAIRIVSSTEASLTRSTARRSDTWMLTSTTRSSSLASIMRTDGASPPGGAAKDCSISVCPGKPMPAAASASLCNGAVTIARAFASSSHCTAASMQRAAAAPQRACTRPQGSSAKPAGRPSGCSTARQPGGTRARSAGASMRASGSCRPTTIAARRNTATSPTTTQSAASPSAKACTRVSGPMPQASPIVKSSGALSMRHCGSPATLPPR